LSTSALRGAPAGILDCHGEFADASKVGGIISATDKALAHPIARPHFPGTTY
jgi:hypothetical protein